MKTAENDNLPIKSIGRITASKGWEQLGVLVLDGSGSMEKPGETRSPKGEEVATAVRGLISCLQRSSKATSFYLAVITYDDRVNSSHTPPTPVLKMNATGDYNPLHGHGGETAIGDALRQAAIVAEDFLSEAKRIPRQAVIILMTDGKNNAGTDPRKVAEIIKRSGQSITICAAGYGRPGDIDESTLREIVTNPKESVVTRDPDTLREFFNKSLLAGFLPAHSYQKDTTHAR